jgi:hypothetical protein
MTRLIEGINIVAQEMVRLDSLELWSVEVEKAIELTRQWANERKEHPGLSLVLCGRPGLGKTHMAKAALWSEAYFVDGQPVCPIGQFYLANDLLLRMSPEQEKGLLQTAKDLVGNASIIVVDDVGHNLSLPFVKSEWQEDERHGRFHAFFDYCYTNHVSVVLTSRLEPKQALCDWIGFHSWDRLLQMARRPFIVHIQESGSYRKRKGAWERRDGWGMKDEG